MRYITLNDYPANGPDAAEVKRLRESLEPKSAPRGPDSVRNFHVASDVLTIATVTGHGVSWNHD